VKLQHLVNNGNLKRNRDGLIEHNGIPLTWPIVKKKLKTHSKKYRFVLKEAFKMLGADLGDDCPDDHKSIIARATELRAAKKVIMSLATFQRRWRALEEKTRSLATFQRKWKALKA
jgi:hypothetical protein